MKREGMQPTDKRKKRRRKRVISQSLAIGIVVLAAAIILFIGIDLGVGVRYNLRFLPSTTVNGLDVSGMSTDEVQDLLLEHETDYTLTLKERFDESETIDAESIGLTLIFDDTLDELPGAQSGWKWPVYLLGLQKDELVVENMFLYDTDMLDEVIASLSCLDPEKIIYPRDAYISGYDIESGSVTIEEEVEGNQVDEERLASAVYRAIDLMETELDLDGEGCYIEPYVRASDQALAEDAAFRADYLSTRIVYEMGQDQVVVDANQLAEWLEFEDDGTVSLNEEAVAGFIRDLASKYNTIYSNREFKTSYGTTVTVNGGDYGWWMDESTEISELEEQILGKESGIREPVWFGRGAVLGVGGDADYGDTYVEVNLTAQHMFYYKNGSLVLESDIVSGKNDKTPTGTFAVLYCERYATLNGENYSSPVSYWMPFYDGVGLHDASWRTSFGGNLYQSNGSHGCINLPISVAKSLYENMESGTAVIVYKLPGTESNTTSSQSYEEIAAAIVDALNEISASGPITSGNYSKMSKRIRWAQAAYNSLSGSSKELVTNYDLLEEALNALNAYEGG